MHTRFIHFPKHRHNYIEIIYMCCGSATHTIVLPEFFDVAFEMIESDNVLKDFLIGSLRKDTGRADYIHFKVADALPVQNLVENMVWSINSPCIS